MTIGDLKLANFKNCQNWWNRQNQSNWWKSWIWKRSTDTSVVKNDNFLFWVSSAAGSAIISLEESIWISSFEVTFREVLMMLAIFDCFFITTASISFSLPQLSSYWKVSLSCYCFLTGVTNGNHWKVLQKLLRSYGENRTFYIAPPGPSFLMMMMMTYVKVWVHPHIFPWLLPIIQTSLSGSIWLVNIIISIASWNTRFCAIFWAKIFIRAILYAFSISVMMIYARGWLSDLVQKGVMGAQDTNAKIALIDIR